MPWAHTAQCHMYYHLLLCSVFVSFFLFCISSSHRIPTIGIIKNELQTGNNFLKNETIPQRNSRFVYSFDTFSRRNTIFGCERKICDNLFVTTDVVCFLSTLSGVLSHLYSVSERTYACTHTHNMHVCLFGVLIYTNFIYFLLLCSSSVVAVATRCRCLCKLARNYRVAGCISFFFSFCCCCWLCAIGLSHTDTHPMPEFNSVSLNNVKSSSSLCDLMAYAWIQ